MKTIIEDFQLNLKVQYLDKIEVKQLLNVNNQVIPLPDTICKDFFLQCDKKRYTLTLKNSLKTYSSRIFTKLSRSLCSELQLKATKCFEIAEDDDVPELTSFISDILSCGSVFNVAKIIQDSLPGIHHIEQELVTPNPVLGEVILECWHHRLDQSMFNNYLPEEWVGYDTENGKIVYAQLLHCINTEEKDAGKLMNRKYLITAGNEPIIVTALQLYKLMSELTESVPQYFELKLYKASNSATTGQEHALQASDRKSIQDAVIAAWSLPDYQKKQALKRLYLQCHPDKNPSATTEFQYLLQEIEKMEKGYPEGPLNRQQQFRAPDSFNFDWNGLFNKWNQTASSNQKYREKDRGISGRGVIGGWHIPKPQINHDEAVRWIKQAECDYVTLSVLVASCQKDKVSSSHPNEKICPSICFMSHEVAEKCLKAGMYAVCGVGNATLKNPNIVSPAHALVQMGCMINVGDADFLRNFSSQTRYPYEYPSTIAPEEKYTLKTAQGAFNAATRIYKAIKKLVEDDD